MRYSNTRRPPSAAEILQRSRDVQNLFGKAAQQTCTFATHLPHYDGPVVNGVCLDCRKAMNPKSETQKALERERKEKQKAAREANRRVEQAVESRVTQLMGKYA